MSRFEQLSPCRLVDAPPAFAPAASPERVRATGTGPVPLIRGPLVIAIPTRAPSTGRPRAALIPVPASLAAQAPVRVVTIPPIAGANPLADVSDDLIADLVDHIAGAELSDEDYVFTFSAVPATALDISGAAPTADPPTEDADAADDFIVSRDALESMDGLELFTRFGLLDS